MDMLSNAARFGGNRWNKKAFASIVTAVFFVCLLYTETGDYGGAVHHIQEVGLKIASASNRLNISINFFS